MEKLIQNIYNETVKEIFPKFLIVLVNYNNEIYFTFKSFIEALAINEEKPSLRVMRKDVVNNKEFQTYFKYYEEKYKIDILPINRYKGTNLAHWSLFECLLYKANFKLFTKYLNCIYNINFDENIIIINQNDNIGSLYNIPVIYNNNYISLIDLYSSLGEKFHESQYYFKTTYNRSNNSKLHIHDKLKYILSENDDYSDKIKHNNHYKIFVRKDLCLFIFLEVDFLIAIEYINNLNNKEIIIVKENNIEIDNIVKNILNEKTELDKIFDKKNNDIVDFKIDFNNFITEEINENFAIAQYDDLKLKFNKRTGFFSAKYIIIQENVSKDIYKMNKFLSREDTKLYLKTMYEYNKNHDIETPKIYNQYNYDNNIECEENLITFENIFYYKESDKLGNNFKGFYLHPDLFIEYSIWVNKKRKFIYYKFMNLLCNESVLYKNSIVKRYKLLCNELTMEVDKLRNKIEIILDKNTQTLRFNEINNNEYLLYNTKYKISTPEKLRDRCVIKTIYSKENFIKLFNEYLEHFGIDGITILDQKTKKYEIKDFSKIDKFIEDLNEDRIIIEEKNFNIDLLIKSQIHKIKDEVDKTNPVILGKYFEYYCAEKFNMILQTETSLVFKYKNNLCSSDRGIDLFDFANQKFVQCKFYKSKLNVSQLYSFDIMSEKLLKYNKNFEQLLIINESCKITNNVEQKYEIIRIPEQVFYNWLLLKKSI